MRTTREIVSKLRVCAAKGEFAIFILFIAVGTVPNSVICGQESRPDGDGTAAPGVSSVRVKRLLTEEDAIRMVRIAGRGAISEYAGSLTKDFAYFSPDQKQFAIVLKKGNLERNTNDYSLLLFQTSEVFEVLKPRVLVSMSSSSNREGITNPVWLPDNDSILFLGENPSEKAQLYSVRSSSGVIEKLTNETANIVAFSSDETGSKIVCAVERVPGPVVTAESSRQGVTVLDEDMSELLAGEKRARVLDLLVVAPHTGERKSLSLSSNLGGVLWGDVRDFGTSPDGRYVVVKTNLTTVPPSWRNYQDPVISRLLARQLSPGALTWIYRYALIDLADGTGTVLLDSAVSYRGSELAWLDGSTRLIMSGVFLPITDGEEASASKGPLVVEVNLHSKELKRVSEEDLRLIAWDAKSGVLESETRPTRASGKEPEPRYWKMIGDRWQSVEGPQKRHNSVTVRAVQDLNTPPKIVVTDDQTGRNRLLLDPNPQFGEIQLGRVEEIKFKGAKQVDVRAGLYFPPDFDARKKYPLVVQTHGFDPLSFWIDGSFTTAFAAQALASHGILVLQVPDRHDWDGTPEEAPNMAQTLERAIEHVDSLGNLDRDKIGLVGFSRTGLYVYYLLTHSRFHFRAAVVADGSDGSYSQYLQFLGAYPSVAADSEAINGGGPFGDGMMRWLRDSIEFRLDLVDTPLMTQAASRDSLSSQWAEFTGLKRLGKPAELLYFPGGTHILEKPWDRLASQQGTVDWCAFWLKDELDSDPVKQRKYARWRALKEALKSSSLSLVPASRRQY